MPSLIDAESNLTYVCSKHMGVHLNGTQGMQIVRYMQIVNFTQFVISNSRNTDVGHKSSCWICMNLELHSDAKNCHLRIWRIKEV